MLGPPTLRVAWLTATTSRLRRGYGWTISGGSWKSRLRDHRHLHGSDPVMRTATTMYRAMDLRFLQE